jgi:hypothetical protein
MPIRASRFREEVREFLAFARRLSDRLQAEVGD